MPTRRIFELMLVTGLCLRPVFGMVRLWSAKQLATSNGGPLHSAAEIATVIV